jgi:hypothetical protein
MAKQTKAERVIEWMEANGFREAPSTSRKYRKFLKQHPNTGLTFYWVGKCGAVRCGATISDSYSVTHLFA